MQDDDNQQQARHEEMRKPRHTPKPRCSLVLSHHARVLHCYFRLDENICDEPIQSEATPFKSRPTGRALSWPQHTHLVLIHL